MTTQQLVQRIKQEVDNFYAGSNDAHRAAVNAYLNLLQKRQKLLNELEQVDAAISEAKTFDTSFGQHVKIKFARFE